MAFERQTAKKVLVSEITSGKWVKKEGMEPSFVVTAQKEKVARARVLATVVGKFVSEDGNFGSITLDDGTDTIRAKAWKELKVFEGVEVGQMTDVVGKVREYNGEIYMMPEWFGKVEDPNTEILRRLEITKRAELLKSGKIKKADEAPEQAADERKELIRKEILVLLDANPKGITYTDVMTKVKHPEALVEAAMNEILEEGICYEPTPGKIMKI